MSQSTRPATDTRLPPGTVEGDGLAIAGMILGYVQLGLILLLVLVAIGLLMLGLGVHGWR